MYYIVHYFSFLKLNQSLMILTTVCGMRDLEPGLQTTTADVKVWHMTELDYSSETM